MSREDGFAVLPMLYEPEEDFLNHRVRTRSHRVIAEGRSIAAKLGGNESGDAVVVDVPPIDREKTFGLARNGCGGHGVGVGGGRGGWAPGGPVVRSWRRASALRGAFWDPPEASGQIPAPWRPVQCGGSPSAGRQRGGTTPRPCDPQCEGLAVFVVEGGHPPRQPTGASSPAAVGSRAWASGRGVWACRCRRELRPGRPGRRGRVGGGRHGAGGPPRGAAAGPGPGGGRGGHQRSRVVPGPGGGRGPGGQSGWGLLCPEEGAAEDLLRQEPAILVCY